MEIVDDHVERRDLYEKANDIELINVMEKTLMLIDIHLRYEFLPKAQTIIEKGF